MNLIIISFTRNGFLLEQRLREAAERRGFEVKTFLKSKYVQAPAESGTVQVEESLGSWAQSNIPGADGVIFVGAAGIAVRTIAPFVKSKKTDPAVLVLDERGNYVIPLLSGHIGGANELAEWIAEETGAVPVITTATDVNHHFAVDVFAKKNNLWISDMRLAKEVSALVLSEVRLEAGAGAGYRPKKGQTVFRELDFRQGISPDGREGTFWIRLPSGEVLHLVPRNVTLGIGCRRGTSRGMIEKKVKLTLEEHGVFNQAVRQIASIDLKKEEPGLIEFCESRKLPLVTFTGDELGRAEGEFTPSAFVSRITGVDNVCERSACLGSGQGTLIVKKQAGDGVTAACAVEDWSVDFE